MSVDELPVAGDPVLSALPDELRDRAARERETALRLAAYLAEHHAGSSVARPRSADSTPSPEASAS